jgi:hypothetical protein
MCHPLHLSLITIYACHSREVTSRSSNPVLRPDNPKDNPDFISGLAILQAAFERSIFGDKSPVYLPRLFPAACFLFEIHFAGQRCIRVAWMPQQVSRKRVPRWSSCPALHRRRFLRHWVVHCLGAGLRHALRHDAPTFSQRRVSASAPVISTASVRDTSCCHRYPVILFAVFLSSAYVVTLRDYPPDDPDRPQMVRIEPMFLSFFP